MIAILDYGSGNLRSALRAFENTGVEVKVTNNSTVIKESAGLVIPGVGAFGACMEQLEAVGGGEIVRNFYQSGKAIFGICVGMQLLAERGLEYETSRGLGWIAGDTVRIEPKDPMLKIPHMGWNTLTRKRTHPVLENIPETLHAYFVHSYHVKSIP